MIDSFSGDYRFLSNFFIEPDATCIESEYQAAKCINPDEAKSILRLSPSHAKKAGRKVDIRPDWDKVKISIMHDLVLRKFEDHAGLRELLLNTGHLRLEENNYWNDTFWGVCNSYGHNHLGRILMDVREFMRSYG